MWSGLGQQIDTASPFVISLALAIIGLVIGRVVRSRVLHYALQRQTSPPATDQGYKTYAQFTDWAVDLNQAVFVFVAPFLSLVTDRPGVSEGGPLVYVFVGLAGVLLCGWVYLRPAPSRYTAVRVRWIGLSVVESVSLLVNAAALVAILLLPEAVESRAAPSV